MIRSGSPQGYGSLHKSYTIRLQSGRQTVTCGMLGGVKHIPADDIGP
jgi:hypothetical protein